MGNVNSAKHHQPSDQNIIFTNNVGEAIDSVVGEIKPSKLFVLVDTNTDVLVLPRLAAISKAVESATKIVIKAGDEHKDFDTLAEVWSQLSENGATRESMLINVGGGVVTDLGGFAAATFKRGMAFINIPTTLLGAVDAAVGGKTGINFNNIKNQIGAFRQADAVVISATFFDTLSQHDLRSGYAEMIKHGLLESPEVFNRLIDSDVADIDTNAMLNLLQESVLVKKRIVDADPTEKGLRRALNLGHTIGHAYETLALERHSPIPHGYAVAYGMLTELVISHMQLGFPSDTLQRYAKYVAESYSSFNFTCEDYPNLLAYMAHDKKNASPERINFTLLEQVGKIKIDCIVGQQDIKTALDITRDLMGI